MKDTIGRNEIRIAKTVRFLENKLKFRDNKRKTEPKQDESKNRISKILVELGILNSKETPSASKQQITEPRWSDTINKNVPRDMLIYLDKNENISEPKIYKEIKIIKN